jgi:predicted nucleic acid-binding protein
LPIVRPRIFLDTNICINVANGSIDPDEWRRVQRRLVTNYRYCISVITLKELFSKLARGDEAHFDQNKGPLKVLDTPAKKTFLPYPHVFALRTVLRIMSAARSDCSGLAEEEWARAVLRAVLDAPSKRNLKHGIPVRNRRDQIQTFDLDHFDAHENRPQHEHAQLLQGIREGRVEKPEPKKTAAWILQDLGFTPYTKHCEKLASSLDAAFRFSSALSKLSRDKGYDYGAHASDWGDSLQLFYLCDPSMHLLTSDGDFRTRTKGSLQSSRILLYSEFVGSLLP